MIRSHLLLLVGLTGGIGAGKSTVARLLEARGAVVIDTDAVARDVVRSGTPAHAAILDRFGRGVEAADGDIDRARLADIVFSDPEARADLNAIVHPAVAAAVDDRLAAEKGADIVVLEVPLLVEAGWAARAAFVVVVESPEDAAIHRLVEQRGMAEADVRRRMATQASPQARRAVADAVIVNDGSLEDLERQVDELWATLVARARHT
jgi:dephospho-CoA kinase